MESKTLKDNIIPLASLLIALVSILTGVYIQDRTIEASRYSATITAKQTGYAKLMIALDKGKAAIPDMWSRDGGDIRKTYGIRVAYYEIELLLDTKDREEIYSKIEDLMDMILMIGYDRPDDPRQSDIITIMDVYFEYAELREEIREALIPALIK